MSMISTESPPQTTEISSLHTDIFETHILTRLDGQTLASTSCTNTMMHSMSQRNNNLLWSNVCHTTWPSTSSDRVNGIISTFSDNHCNGHKKFFSQTFPLPSSDPTTTATQPSSSKLATVSPSELISAVDVYYKNKLIFTKIEETETVSSWFQCSPFRIDLLDPKDTVPTEIPHPKGEDTCMAMMDDMSLSWILINPVSKLAINLSSHKPVSVQRHWLSGEVQVRFGSILAGGNHKYSSDAAAVVRCGIVVNFGQSEGGEMQVRELCLEIEDMDGKHLNGKDSLVILRKTMEGKRGSGVNRENEARIRHKKFEEMKKERKDRKLRLEGR